MNKIILSKSDIKRFKTKFTKKSFRECWNWKTGLSSNGYGKIKINRRTIGAHRIAYFLHYKIDPLGKLVCHHCDNPACCNPYHLFLGTYQDNRNDCVKKKRHAFGDKNGVRLHPECLKRGNEHWTHKHPEKLLRGNNHWTRKFPHLVKRGDIAGPHLHPERMARGEKNGSAKLTDKQILKIRKQFASGKIEQKQLVKIYKVSKSLISAIIIRKIWKHI